MDNKAPEAFRTISEVADDLDVPKHVLRFWEGKFSQLKPMKRGGGRRYYRPEDVALLKGIRHLLYGQGYTIRGVQKILRESGPRSVMEMREAGAEQGAHRSIPDVAAEAARNLSLPSIPSESDTPPDMRFMRDMLEELADCRRILADAKA